MTVWLFPSVVADFYGQRNATANYGVMYSAKGVSSIIAGGIAAMLFERFGARMAIMRIMVLWGITSAAMMFVQTPMQFYGLRFLLGVFEAGMFPGILLYLTYWFPSARRGKATGLFLFSLPVAGVIGGPLSGWIMTHFDGVSGLGGWQWLFLLEGLPSIVFGLVWYFVAVSTDQVRCLDVDTLLQIEINDLFRVRNTERFF